MIRRLLQSRTGARAPVTRGERHTTNETTTITIIIMTESCRRAPVKYFMRARVCVCVTWRAARRVIVFCHMAEATAETTKQSFIFRNNLDFCQFFCCIFSFEWREKARWRFHFPASFTDRLPSVYIVYAVTRHIVLYAVFRN